MLAVLFSWIIITFILFSFGEMLASIYNRYCNRYEKYNLLDKILLGICFITMILSIWSLLLPSNHVFLSVCIIISVLYWIVNKNKAQDLFLIIKNKGKQLSRKQKFIIAFFFILILIGNLWIPGVFDSLYYHHQNIRWNEEYAIVPGLGNLEDRFGFNSNYLLLSSIFTFRFIFGEALYTINSLLFIILWTWILYELFTSRYEIRRVFILISFSLFYLISLIFIYDTSTDLLPNLIAFYLVAKLILSPESTLKNKLLFFILPVFMVTCKLSVFPFCIFSLYILIVLLKEKEYKTFSFNMVFGLLIGFVWLIRNVIISGYLIYPMYEIDLFSFDWKIPQSIAINAREYISFVGHEFFTFITTTPFSTYRDPFWVNILTLIIYVLCILFTIIILYKLIVKRRNIPLSYYLSALVLFLCFVIWFKNGPDMRFIPGISTVFLSLGGAFIFYTKNKISIPFISTLYIVVLLLFNCLWTSREIYRCHLALQKAETTVPTPYSRILFLPYSQEWLELHSNIEKDIYKSAINNDIYIYISKLNVTYDILPAVAYNERGKFVNNDCIEARGYSLQDGFRTKKGYKENLN